MLTVSPAVMLEASLKEGAFKSTCRIKIKDSMDWLNLNNFDAKLVTMAPKRDDKILTD